jgi:hypothetical protein
MTLRERYDAKVQVGEFDECWPWTAAVKPNGYGMMNVHGKTRSAHRLAWTFAHGPIPDGLMVCHHCDNRKCCNPSHLFLGTARDNTRDMIAKGRFREPTDRARGGRNGNSKLTGSDVALIRELADQGFTYAVLADKFGVTAPNISMIHKRRTWRQEVTS